MYLAPASQLVQLVNFEPYAVRDRAVQLVGAQQRTAEGPDRALDGQAQVVDTVAVLHVAFLRDDHLVAGGQMVLQGLGEVGYLAWPVFQNDGLAQVIAGQGGADVMYLRTDQFEHGQPAIGCDPRLRSEEHMSEL